jgi:hypothetical protein
MTTCEDLVYALKLCREGIEAARERGARVTVWEVYGLIRGVTKLQQTLQRSHPFVYARYSNVVAPALRRAEGALLATRHDRASELRQSDKALDQLDLVVSKFHRALGTCQRTTAALGSLGVTAGRCPDALRSLLTLTAQHTIASIRGDSTGSAHAEKASKVFAEACLRR